MGSGPGAALSEQKAYEAIREGITSGTYPGGRHLRAADLAAQLGVSRTPVREALRRLHAEGLVEVLANRGAFVTEITSRDIDEVFELRVMLESHAAELSAPRFTPAEVVDLVTMTDRMETAVAGPARDLQGLTRANEAFHSTIVRAAANRRLGALIAGVVELSWVSLTFSVYSDADLARSIAHHREMIDAFRAQDAMWAGATMRSHIRAAWHVLRSAGGKAPPDHAVTPPGGTTRKHGGLHEPG